MGTRSPQAAPSVESQKRHRTGGTGGARTTTTGGTHVLSELRHEKPRREQVLQDLRNRPVRQRSWCARTPGDRLGSGTRRARLCQTRSCGAWAQRRSQARHRRDRCGCRNRPRRRGGAAHELVRPRPATPHAGNLHLHRQPRGQLASIAYDDDGSLRRRGR